MSISTASVAICITSELRLEPANQSSAVHSNNSAGGLNFDSTYRPGYLNGKTELSVVSLKLRLGLRRPSRFAQITLRILINQGPML